MSTYWARTSAPAPDATARLILIGICDNPAGDENNAIHVDRLIKQCRTTREAFDKYMNWFIKRGMIVVKESEQITGGIPGKVYPIICYVNTEIEEEGW